MWEHLTVAGVNTAIGENPAAAVVVERDHLIRWDTSGGAVGEATNERSLTFADGLEVRMWARDCRPQRDHCGHAEYDYEVIIH